jgi:hypothetical protein
MTSKDNQVNTSRYEMDHAKRGIALIININKYDNPNPFKLEERVWSIKDVENLKKTLGYLEFDVKLVENLTKSKIVECLNQIATEFDHSDFDCFLCVVMSHGKEDNIVTSDIQLMSFEEIMKPIKMCLTLFNKPKMFFFQACRGDKQMESTGLDAKEHDHAPDLLLDISSNLHTYEKKNDATKFENFTDFLICYSTLPNHLSYANDEKEGTIFIKSFCDVFNDAYKNLPNNMSLEKMSTRINESVSKTAEQISELVYRMRKDVYFLPKNVSQNFTYFIFTYVYCPIKVLKIKN